MKNIKKDGFTLVELLAVIAILAILVAMVMPNIMTQYNETKVNVFVTDTQTYMESAKSKYMMESLNNNAESLYFSSQMNDYLKTKKLDIDSNNEYFIEMDRHGNFKRVVIYNENYCYDVHTNYGEKSIGDLVGTKSILIDEQSKIEKDMVNSKHVYLSGKDEIVASVKLENNKVISYKVKGCEGVQRKEEVVNNLPCQYEGELVQGAQLIYGSYTYKYKQELDPNTNTWVNTSNDGWGVILTDKNNTSAINDSICENINERPIVSMSAMFKDSKASSVDLSNFNTKNVVNMQSMFENTLMETIDVTKFKTEKVTNMSKMFAYSNVKKLDLSKFSTSSNPIITDMFKESALEQLTLGTNSILKNNTSIPNGVKIIQTVYQSQTIVVSRPAISGVVIPASTKSE